MTEQPQYSPKQKILLLLLLLGQNQCHSLIGTLFCAGERPRHGLLPMTNLSSQPPSSFLFIMALFPCVLVLSRRPCIQDQNSPVVFIAFFLLSFKEDTFSVIYIISVLQVLSREIVNTMQHTFPKL